MVPGVPLPWTLFETTCNLVHFKGKTFPILKYLHEPGLLYLLPENNKLHWGQGYSFPALSKFLFFFKGEIAANSLFLSCLLLLWWLITQCSLLKHSWMHFWIKYQVTEHSTSLYNVINNGVSFLFFLQQWKN